MTTNKPLVKVNGQVISSQSEGLEYVANSQLILELADAQKVTISELKGVKYEWNMGDGAIIEGATAKHVYKKTGTFTVSVASKSGLSASQIVESFTVHSLPELGYQRAKPVISVNTNKAEDHIELDFATEIKFDASRSTPGSAAIAKYDWDFGDKTVGQGREVSHAYWPQHYNAKATLRLTDENGIASQSTIELINKIRQEKPQVENKQSPNKLSKPKVYLALTILLFAIAIPAIVIYKRKAISSPK